jgi:Cu/Ag efflux protein CusF
MKSNRRSFFSSLATAGAALTAGVKTLSAQGVGADAKVAAGSGTTEPFLPVVLPDGKKLPYTLADGVKEFHLAAEVVKTAGQGHRIRDEAAWGLDAALPHAAPRHESNGFGGGSGIGHGVSAERSSEEGHRRVSAGHVDGDGRAVQEQAGDAGSASDVDRRNDGHDDACSRGDAGVVQPHSGRERRNEFGGGGEQPTLVGRVVGVSEGRLTLNHDKVEGWMDAMTMAYPVDKTVGSVKVGDQISATVFDGDLTLHDVKVVGQ